jgi:hypothetical protein
MPARRLAATWGAPLAAPVLLLLLLFSLAGCGSGPATPEELFERIVSALNQGRPGVVYDLLSTEEKQRWVQGIANNKDTSRRNPGARKMLEQYQMTYEEFQAATPAQVWDRAHSHMENVLRGARIIDKTTDPVNGTDVWITYETSAKQRFRFVMRHEEGRGWTLQRGEPVKLE